LRVVEKKEILGREEKIMLFEEKDDNVI